MMKNDAADSDYYHMSNNNNLDNDQKSKQTQSKAARFIMTAGGADRCKNTSSFSGSLAYQLAATQRNQPASEKNK